MELKYGIFAQAKMTSRQFESHQNGIEIAEDIEAALLRISLNRTRMELKCEKKYLEGVQWCV